MASRRFYAYYIRGNQLALVEHDSVSGDGQTLGQPSLDDIGPSGGLQWKSPVASITEGLEIEYAYSPRYTHPSGYAAADRIHLNAWIIQNGYLAFVQDVQLNPTSNANTEGFAWATFAGVTAPTSDTYILVQNSERWNGIHKVQSYTDPANDGGISSIQTYTKVSKANYGYYTGTPNFDASDTAIESIPDDRFALNDYIWVSGTQAQNRGLFRIDSITAQTAFPGYEDLDGLTKYFRAGGGGAAISSIIDETISTATAHASSDTTALFTLTDDTNGTIHINQAFLENDSTYLVHGVDVLNDETDTIDLPEYLSKGLVYYVQAKVAEDQGDIERKEYFMREFRRILEKHESSKIRGPRMMIPGGHGIR